MIRAARLAALIGIVIGVTQALASTAPSIGGVYCGTAISGGEPVEVRTTLRMQANGRLVGSYQFADRGGSTPGELQENMPQPGNSRTLVWRDKYGVGLATFAFNESGDAFDGHWGVGLGLPSIPWNGKRCEMPSV